MRKVWCEVLEAAVYSDRCLYRLSKMVESNKTCTNCIVHELERMKSSKSKSLDANDIKDINDIEGINDVEKKRGKIKGRPGKKSTKTGQTKRMYTTEELSEILGKAERTLQEWGQKGRIPAVRVGIKWRFPKEGVDRWLSRRKGDGCGIPHTKQSEELPEPVNSPGSPSSSEDPLFCSIETKEG